MPLWEVWHVEAGTKNSASDVIVLLTTRTLGPFHPKAPNGRGLVLRDGLIEKGNEANMSHFIQREKRGSLASNSMKRILRTEEAQSKFGTPRLRILA